MKASGKYLLGMALVAVLTLATATTQAALTKGAKTDISPHREVSHLIQQQPFETGTVAIQVASHERDGGNADRRQRPRKLSPEQRERVEQGRQRFQALPQRDRERIQDARKRYRALPSNERERLRQQWQQKRSERGRARGGEDRTEKRERDR